MVNASNIMIRRRLIILIFFSFISLISEPIKFSGSLEIYAEFDTLYGVKQDRPSRDLRWKFNPNITVFDMPLSFNLFLTNLESNLLQRVNKFRISLEPNKLSRERVHLPGFLYSISGIQIGASHPDYSYLTLSGIPVNGFALELNPGIFYFAFTSGEIQRGGKGSDPTDFAYQRMLYAGKFGFGKKDKNHLYFTILKSRDNPNSISPYTIPVPRDTSGQDTVEVKTPEENFLIGIELKISLFKDKFSLESELVGSQFTKDVRTSEVTLKDFPNFVNKILHPRISSSYDYAYSIKPSLNILGANIYGGVKMIGPGFKTHGNPYLRNDNLVFELGGSRKFGFFSFSTSFLKEENNLLNFKKSTTSLTSYNISMSLTPTKLPYFQISYNPYIQKNNTLNTENKSSTFSLSSGYSFSYLGVGHSLSINSSYQDYKGENNKNNYKSTGLSLTYSTAFKIPLSTSIGAGITKTIRPEETSNLFTLDLSASYTFFKSWANTLGFNIASEDKRSKKGLYLTSSFPVRIIGNTSIRLERNIYRDIDKSKNYNEFLVRFILSRSW